MLVLGSFPGTVSIESGQYYANPRNTFWDIIEAHLQVPREIPYQERVTRLTSLGVALWDVIGSCEREGAMDHAIRDPVINDIPGFVRDHPSVFRIIANGRTAGKYLQRYTGEWPLGVQVLTLPSTSPAHARMTLEEKILAWEPVRPVSQ